MRDAAPRRVTFEDEPEAEWADEHGDRPAEQIMPALPETPAQQQATPGTPDRPAPVQPPTGGRPTRARKLPDRFRDYEMAEMSVKKDVRRPTSPVREDDDVEGMLEDDMHGAEASDGGETGYENPDVPGSRETRATCIGAVLSGLKDLCRMNGINEIQTASLMGQVAVELCQTQE